MLVAVLIFCIVLAVIFGSYWAIVLRPEEQEGRALRKRLKVRVDPQSIGQMTVVKDRHRLSALGPLERFLGAWQSVGNPLQRLLERSGTSFNAGTVVLASVFLAFVGLIVGVGIASSLGAGIVAAALFGAAPVLLLRRQATSRLATFEEQFPDAIDLLARSLRAGHALPTALQNAADEVPDPVGGEFRTLFDQQNYGMSLTEALRSFAERIPVLDARFFVTAVLTQRETGGNLSEVLDNLAAVIRERFKVKRQVRVVSAHGRITGWVLGFLPPAVACVLYLIAPNHIALLVTDPLGFRMLILGLALQAVGIMIIRRIVDVEY
jgi:tight adherence protein B